MQNTLCIFIYNKPSKPDITSYIFQNFSFLCENGKWSLAPAYDITYSPEGTRGEHATSVRYSGNPKLEDIISAGTGIRISRKRCIEIIEEIESVCTVELDVDKIVKIKG